MPRPRTPISSHGAISLVEVEPGKWRARTRFRFEDGRLRQVERFAPTKAKAEISLKRAMTTLTAAAGVDTKRETRIRDLADRFLASKADRAPRTLEAYEQAIGHLVLPRLGDVTVAEATPDRLQRFLDAVRLEHGPGAARSARAVLSGMLGLATRSGAVRTNPVRELEVIEKKPKGATPVPLDELAGILEKVRGDERLAELDVADLVEFVAGSGLRISEAIALQWADVDLEAGAITVRANVVRAKGRGLIRQAHSKTDAGTRTIRVAPALVGLLGDRRVRASTELVFPTILGNLRDPRNTAADWAAARERLAIGEYTFHSFRKTVGTALDQAGLSARDIAEYLGHADPSLTQQVYMSKTVGGPRAANALDGLLGRG